MKPSSQIEVKPTWFESSLDKVLKCVHHFYHSAQNLLQRCYSISYRSKAVTGWPSGQCSGLGVRSSEVRTPTSRTLAFPYSSSLDPDHLDSPCSSARQRAPVTLPIIPVAGKTCPMDSVRSRDTYIEHHIFVWTRGKVEHIV